MKIIAALTGPVLAAVFAGACGGTQENSAIERAEMRQRAAEEDARQARQDSDRARDEARNARHEAREAARAQRDAERSAEAAEQQAVLAERHEQDVQGPRAGRTELQGGNNARRPADRDALVVAPRGVERESIIVFAPGTTELSVAAKAKLDSIAPALRARLANGENLLIDGYAAEYVGADARNQELGRQRAEEVARYLANKGLPKDRIHTKGFGSRSVVNSKDSSPDRMVRITIEPAGK